MKIPSVKRCVSGLMAAMMVLTSCGTSTPVFADELEYPPLQSVIDQLDADEIVRPNDYMVSVGEEFNVKVDFSNLDIPDASKVNIYLDEAINAEGSLFSTDHADTYRTTYHVEPVSGHPVYQISRSIRVKEVEKTAPVSAESTQTEPNESNEGGSPAVEQSGEDSPDEDPQPDENGSGAAENSSMDSDAGNGTESAVPDLSETEDGQEQTTDLPMDESSVADESEVTSETDSSLSLDEEPGQETESGIGSTLTEDVPLTEEDDDKPSILSVIVSGIAGLFAKDDAGVPEDELIDEALVGASGAAIDATVNCTTSSFGSVYVNHAYQTSGNSGGDVIIYCGEVDMHFSEGAHTRQNLVGNTLEGHTVTAAEALRVGIMQYYFWNKAGVGNDKARGLTQRAVWAMAVGDEASGVSNTVYLTQAGLLDVYNAAKAYASANASKFELDECYVLAQGSAQKLVYISVSEKPDEGSAKLVKKSSDAAVSGNSSYSLKGAVYGVYSDKDCTKKVKELTTGEDGTSNTVKLSAGTYYVKEITAPKNFKKDGTVHTVKVESGKTATVTVTDTPEKTPIHVLKTSENGEGMPVSGTVYTVYSDAECTNEAGTLTVGDDGRSNVLEVLYGTYYVKETKAAEGYMIDTEIHTVECRSAEEMEISLSDRAVRGGVKIGKWEAETERRDPQGASSLGGTAFAIVNKSENPVLIDGEMYENGATIATVKTDKDGYWESKSDWLSYGSYAVIETTAPEGHENAGTVIDFEIRNDGEVIDLDKGQLMDQVFRGDLELVKVGQNKKERLANIAFLVTSKTTGEAHVLVTDPNGQAGTASSYAAHTQDTNRNDEAYKDGKIDDAKLSHSYGIWFSGEEDATVIPDDAKGALPYDTYTVQELRCAANEGYELVSYDITIYRNGAVVDCGTVDDDEIPKIERSTDYAKEQVYSIVDERYKSGLPIIVTTNLTITDLRCPQQLGDARIYSRILEMCTPVHVPGKDRRAEAGRTKQEIMKEVLMP